ncbi:Major Facilitator Superfamily protein [Actinacidiphila yanglinensis]|uniref:Major Facilitator Superfamily protein n=1 Tax=Actinacidiphila yanglinensis TaxID=310779 RepID=A0A1H6E502_9ACTN|nr:MFS transporter [Actinacidiphila yanglinensis]SEG92066.1 Major Facilitator Superfamily protein [Actinacidiphila yanglinensis]
MPSAAPRVSAAPGDAPGAPPPAEQDAPAGRATGTLLALILTGQFMATLDVSIVNVAARTIQRDLHASGPALQVIVAGYTIVYAVLLISSARLGGRHGYRRLFLTGTALVTAASLACGLAPGAGWLIGFRLVQGAGAALLVPQVMSLIQHSLTGPSRVRALGVYTAVLAAGAVVGQILGGVLVGADLLGSGWRAVFLVNVPVGVVLLAAGRRLLPAVEGTRARRLDLPGLLLLAAALGLLVTPLVLGHETGWPAWTWVLLAASAAAFTAFVRFERRLTARGGDPLIEGRVLRSPGLVPAAAAICLVLVTFSGFLFVCALHFQGALRYGPERAGLLFVPLVVTFGLGGLYWRRLPARLHPALPVAGLLATALGYGALALLQRDGGQAGAAVETALAVVGLSSGIAYGPLFGLALGRVGAADAADASGLMNTVIQLGQVLGVSVIGTLFLSRVALPAAGAASGHALAVATWVVAAVAVLAAACAHLAGRAAGHPDVNPEGAAARRRNEGSPTSPPGTSAGQRTEKVEHMQDEKRVMEFLERVVADQAAAFAGVSTSLGIRLGLYRAMSGAGALTCAELAKSTGVAERYVREWLAAQVAGAYVLHDAEADTYVLPDAHAAVLADSSCRRTWAAASPCSRPSTAPRRRWSAPTGPAAAWAGRSTGPNWPRAWPRSSGPATRRSSSRSGCPPWRASRPSSGRAPRSRTWGAASATRRC